MQTRWLISSRHRLLADPSTDAALLRRYAEDRDAAAFECLLWRHGGMVLATCQRTLRDRHLAEDAYQATFLILARKAGTVRGVLPAWLHRVARRVCLRLQKRWPERLGADVAEDQSKPDCERRELSAVLDGEIAKLPEKHRRVVVLCYLQNLTAEAAARELGIPRGTVLSRLDTARRKLQAALTRRGIAPLAILTIPLIHAQPSAALVQATQEASLAFFRHAAPTPITELAHEVLQMTTRKWIAGSAVGLIALAFASTGLGLFTVNGTTPSQVAAQAPPANQAQLAATDDAKLRRLDEQKQQLAALHGADLELKQRIDNLNAKVAKEQAVRDAEVSARALMQAIDKIDQSILDEEAKLPEMRDFLANQTKLLRVKKDYPAEMFSSFDHRYDKSKNSFPIVGMADARPLVFEISEYSTYIKAMEAFDLEARDFLRGSPKYAELDVRRKKYFDDYLQNSATAVDKKILQIQRDAYHSSVQQQIRRLTESLQDAEGFPKFVAKRRAELVERLRKASGNSEEQKLLDDELQVLREFRKAVLKQKLTLKLEIDGVKLPEEPKK